MTYDYLPQDEDNKLVDGIYKVSFEIKVESRDEFSLSDVTHDLTEGLVRGFGDDFINKVAALNIERVQPARENKTVKIGDRVCLKEDIQLTADVYNDDDGYFFIGTPNDISEKITTNPADLRLKRGNTGLVNKINKDGSLEVVNLDDPYTDERWKDLGIDAINIDLITVKADQVERLKVEDTNV